jgi:hypothetical protein
MVFAALMLLFSEDAAVVVLLESNTPPGGGGRDGMVLDVLGAALGVDWLVTVALIFFVETLMAILRAKLEAGC